MIVFRKSYIFRINISRPGCPKSNIHAYLLSEHNNREEENDTRINRKHCIRLSLFFLSLPQKYDTYTVVPTAMKKRERKGGEKSVTCCYHPTWLSYLCTYCCAPICLAVLLMVVLWYIIGSMQWFSLYFFLSLILWIFVSHLHRLLPFHIIPPTTSHYFLCMYASFFVTFPFASLIFLTPRLYSTLVSGVTPSRGGGGSNLIIRCSEWMRKTRGDGDFRWQW